jgi:perosamine synthetase
MIPWWKTSFGEDEIQSVSTAMRNKCISQGPITAKFEHLLSELLEVENVIAVSNGSIALLMSLMAVGLKPGDEVIIPNRTWISAAHAANLLGAKVILIDVQPKIPIMDINLIEHKITPRTKVILPIHMNGRSTDMRAIRKLAKKNKISVIEDAAQALLSKNIDGYLGTQSDIGCFSLGMTKLLPTGNGGFAVTSNNVLASRLRAIRTHGVENIKDPKEWRMSGFNFRFGDIQASIGIEQLKKIFNRVNTLLDIYSTFAKGLKGSPFKLIPSDLEMGEVPLYNEYLVPDREFWIKKLQEFEIESRPFYPNINTAEYLSINDCHFPNSQHFAEKGIYLPSGPGQEPDNIKRCIETIKRLTI